MKIGILHGDRESFPQAVLESLNRSHPGSCSYLCVGALDPAAPESNGWRWDLIVDLFSTRMPFYREALYLLEQSGTSRILNSPTLLRSHNRATVRRIAKGLGFQVASAVLLPAKTPPKALGPEGFVNLRYPLDWKAALETVGPFPHLRPLDFNGDRGSIVQDVGNLWRRYNASRKVLQELVSSPKTDEVYRVFVVGKGRFVRQVESLTHQLLPSRSLEPDLERLMIEAADTLLEAIPASIVAIEFGLHEDGLEFLDFDPVPELEWWSLGEYDFARSVRGLTELLKEELTSGPPGEVSPGR